MPPRGLESCCALQEFPGYCRGFLATLIPENCTRVPECRLEIPDCLAVIPDWDFLAAIPECVTSVCLLSSEYSIGAVVRGRKCP